MQAILVWVARTVVFAELCKLVKKIVGQDEIVRLVLSVLLYFKLTIGYSSRTDGRRFKCTIIPHTAALPTELALRNLSTK